MPASKRFKREARREVKRLREQRATEASGIQAISRKLAEAFDMLSTEIRSTQNPRYKRELLKARQKTADANKQVHEAKLHSHVG